MKILFITNDLNFKLGADIIAGFPRSDTIVVLSILASGPQRETLEGLGVRVIEMNFIPSLPRVVRRSKLLKKFLFLCVCFNLIGKITDVVSDLKPDIIHTNLWLSDIVGIISAKRCGIKNVISTQHDSVRINFIARLLKTWLLRSAANVIAISKNVADFSHQYFRVPVDKIIIIPNGINFNYFLNCGKEKSDWGPVIGQIGRLEKIKGQLFLLQALKKVKEAYGVSLQTILIGSGSEEKRLKNYSRSNGLSVEFVPLTPDIGPWLKKIDILVVPSLEEGFGVVLLEGLAAKKLVIASNVGGIPEIIEDRKNGLLIEKPLDQTIAKSLLWSIQNKDAALNLREKGFDWILQNKEKFSVENTTLKYRALFNKLTQS